MKLSFSFKKQEASLEADVEGLVKPCIDARLDNPQRKTRYQIRQEEKRKNAELKHKQDMQRALIAFGLFAICMFFICIMAMFD
ncbi:MAG: hypothetical protein IJX04_04440 [Oscillospiraceae bacterium]|nr:hypothetical protein [Oscillospiraceae bacterium]